jgi:Na+-transporting methylmalonyl-CoA/oxaloacetate decarboxylase gamma subunit
MVVTRDALLLALGSCKASTLKTLCAYYELTTYVQGYNSKGQAQPRPATIPQLAVALTNHMLPTLEPAVEEKEDEEEEEDESENEIREEVAKAIAAAATHSRQTTTPTTITTTTTNNPTHSSNSFCFDFQIIDFI